ncbi:CheR family methyltransferase [Zavarzinia compransoris]|uniref:protein-glutamate O-methyltransferase n=1 Tax=Zavarzinia compransoris TaxID=1264899 RepID=A0A317E5G7_9PROT|nr:protein-glutamate O-methyltransferase CheR [Zavarzinia compransoris]PWR22317.1 chemotaxis protein CheR [Zavarzinia compransoris]TDP46918.1 CheR-type MCP methyltransferase [Zavarzinia compransoris]
MNPLDFQFLSDLLKAKSGLVLTGDKGYLVESRLLPIARKRGLNTLEGLVAGLRRKDEALIRDVVEAMTTNESFFFRDNTPFDTFKAHVMPHLLSARADSKRIRIWSAAASTGQEPYSLAMLLSEQKAALAGWRVEILGTDISADVLTRARAGLYTQFEVQRGLPIQLLVKYFKKEGDQWRIAPEIRSMVQYREYNLLDSFAGLGKFDVVYCRNVLIYFDQPTKAKVLDRIADIMTDDGMLFLGAAETVLGLSTRFRPVKDRRGLYEVVPGR